MPPTSKCYPSIRIIFSKKIFFEKVTVHLITYPEIRNKEENQLQVLGMILFSKNFISSSKFLDCGK